MENSKNELINENLYNEIFSYDIYKIKELALNAKSKNEREFYNNLYELALQTKQIDLIERGVF